MWQLTKHLRVFVNKRWQSSLTREPHRLYYVCRLREMFRRDTAEMAPWWLYLVASAIDHDRWPPSSALVLLYYNTSRPVHVQARFLTAPAGFLTCFLTAQAGLLTRFLTLRAPDRFKSGRPVYNPVDWLTNGSTVNNRAVTYTPTHTYTHPHTPHTHAHTSTLSIYM